MVHNAMRTQNTNAKNHNFILGVLTARKKGLKVQLKHVQSRIQIVSVEEVEAVDSMKELKIKNESLKKELKAERERNLEF